MIKLENGKYYIYSGYGNGTIVFLIDPLPCDSNSFHTRIIYADRDNSHSKIYASFYLKNKYTLYIRLDSPIALLAVKLSPKDVKKYIKMGEKLYQEMINEDIVSNIL